MADHRSVAAAANSVVRLIGFGFEQAEPLDSGATRVNLVRTEDLDPNGTPTHTVPPALTLFVYRVDYNKTLRAAWSAVGHQDGVSHLPLDLHLLMTAWGTNAEDELSILTRAMQVLEDTPLLSGATLDPSSNWSSGEAVQVCMEDLSTEDVMRVFDSLPLDYKLSIPYAARVVVVDGRQASSAGAATSVVPGLGTGVGS